MIKAVIIFLLVIQSAFAECDWSKIKKNEDGSYIYPKDLHLCVGKLVENEKDRIAQVESLNKAIELKDLAIQKTENRAESWRTAAYSLEDRISSQQRYSVYRDWAFFGMGILAFGFSTYMAGHIYK